MQVKATNCYLMRMGNNNKKNKFESDFFQCWLTDRGFRVFLKQIKHIW